MIPAIVGVLLCILPSLKKAKLDKQLNAHVSWKLATLETLYGQPRSVRESLKTNTQRRTTVRNVWLLLWEASKLQWSPQHPLTR
jgi:hypothetical protein